MTKLEKQLSKQVTQLREILFRSLVATDISSQLLEPISCIPFWVKEIEEGLDSSEFDIADIKACLNKIEDCVSNIVTKIDNMRTLSEDVDFDLIKLVKSQVIRYNKLRSTELSSRNITLDFEWVLETAPVCSNIDLIQFIICNLIENSLMYSKDDSTILLSVQERSNQYVFIIINESSFPFELVANNIFEPFYSPGETGAGLSLWRSKQIVEEFGGKIGFSYNPSGDVCFHFTVNKKLC